LLNRAPYKTNPEETKEIQHQVQELFDKGYVRESLSVTPPNNFNKFGGVTTLQDNNKTQAIEI
jgi:hypothetical protein